jgi:hypothetical protein
MSNKIKILLGAVLSFVLVIGFLFLSYTSAYDLGNRYERGLDASVANSQAVLSNTIQIIMESAKVPAMARDDLKDVIKEGLQGRYGETGSKSLVQAITENYPGQLDMSLYTRIQDQIETQRMNFTSAQQIVIDRKRSYETDLGSFWTGFWLNKAGYPKIDLSQNKYNPIINVQTGESFNTGIDTGINF